MTETHIHTEYILDGYFTIDVNQGNTLAILGGFHENSFPSVFDPFTKGKK